MPQAIITINNEKGFLFFSLGEYVGHDKVIMGDLLIGCTTLGVPAQLDDNSLYCTIGLLGWTLPIVRYEIQSPKEED